ncbi:tryptophan transporter [Bacillus velezensis]|uniref:tryptophan transporter n=1 Tax=Bacillus velezensis TaxID=492670 RepID=UPI001A917282|nr:tryptophan transporter [Bacillus velezensis]
MKTKELVIMALFAAIGAVLHSIMPPVLFGMKPDMMLVMMFMGILLFPRVQNVLMIGIVTGIISALTTSFPGGQLPNIIEKPVTAFLFLALALLVKKSVKTAAAVITIAGTFISGLLFLALALLIVGLPGGFTALVLAVVLPAAALNAIAIIIMHPIVQTILKRSNMIETVK